VAKGGDAASGRPGGAAVRILAARDLRRRWRSMLVLALLVGVVGAVVLASAAGARRTSSSLGRLIRDSRAADLEIDAGATTPEQMAAFAQSPGVAVVALLHAYAVDVGGQSSLQSGAITDSTFGSAIDRARIVEGRAADPSAVDEVTIGESLAAQLHLRVGDTLTATSLTPDQLARTQAGNDPGPPEGPELHWRIVGIDRRPLDLGDLSAAGGVVILTPAFDRAYRDRIAVFTDVLRVRTKHPSTDNSVVAATARRLLGTSPGFQVKELSIENRGGQDVIDVMTLALWVFSAVTALAGAVTVAIVIGRDMSRRRGEQEILRAIGMTHGARAAANAPRALFIAVAGAVAAVVGAVAASPLFPV
jgi:predicted lysophospholipase L1 biosynthesis ABC-type transport system permease subunit